MKIREQEKGQVASGGAMVSPLADGCAVFTVDGFITLSFLSCLGAKEH